MPFRELKAYLWNWARSLAELDPRSLACLRIGLGAVLLYDIGLAWEVIDLWPGIQAYFDGMPLPAWAHPAGDVATLKVLFGVYALLALGLLLGYRTRFCALGALLVTGVHRAVAQTVDFHDDVIFHALLWMQMIDAGRCFSLDARGGRRAAWSDRWSRVGACGLVFNVAYIYLSTVYEKGDPAWWPDGRAVYYALSDVALSGPLGRWMVAHLPLAALQFLSYQALAMELAGGLLLLSPWARPRQVGLSLLMLLQLGLWVCMRLESFPGIMLTVQMALVPGWVWPRLGIGERALARAIARPRWWP